MAEPKVRLDRSPGRPYSTCHGERTPDDPHYRVHFWQGGKFGKDMVLLPFDSNGDLVPDDGKTASYQGLGIDQKGNTVSVDYKPLYDELMRKYLKAKLERLARVAEGAASQEPMIEDEHDDDPLGGSPEDDVDFKAWLLGEVRYPPTLVRIAMKKKHHLVQNDIGEIVRELVFEHKLVPAEQVCADLGRFLKTAAAA